MNLHRLFRFLMLFIVFVSAFSITPPVCTADDNGTVKTDYLFYHPRDYGSESQFNPISSFINYSMDTLQVPESFDDRDFSNRLDETWGNLTDPFSAIEREGGFKRFINRQIFPVDFGNLRESREMIPNYTLHLIGGGMVYRKNTEWFEAHGYRYPKTYAALMGIAAEFLQEVFEKKSTSADDEVADVYIFHPAGMLLFNWDKFAQFASETLQLAEWPYQPMFRISGSSSGSRFMNVAENFVVRPAVFRTEKHRPFLFFGMTILLGMSHQLNGSDTVSWGIGEAVRRADRDDFETRLSGGIFYDRNDSLLSSLIINGTENLKVRLNIYPGVLFASKWAPGMFFGIADNGGISAGFSINMIPLGLGGVL